MKVYDSNLIIYSALDQYKPLRLLVTQADAAVSAITKVETPGYHKLPQEDKEYFEALLTTITILPVDESIIDLATELRRQRKMTLGDCLIAATALLNGLDLYTRNTDDFEHIPGLTVIDPFDE